MNKVILIGNLTRDPELRETPNGTPVCSFGIAVRRDFGEDATDFFNINVWQTQAKNCNEYLKKGSKVGIVGTLQTRSYEDKDGIKRNVTEINAREVEFLSPKQAEEDVVSIKRPQLEEITDNHLPF
jgi:single-strand DNA-binding protein